MLFNSPFAIRTQELEDLQKEHEKQRQEIVAEKKRLLEQQEVIKSKLKRHEEEIEAKRKIFSLEMEKVTRSERLRTEWDIRGSQSSLWLFQQW